MVQVLLLGPVAARGNDGEELNLGARARRNVLAALAEQPGRVVSVDALTDRLWGDSPPPTATNLLQGYVGKLRQILGDAAIETRPPGYVLHADTDAMLFDDLVRRARDAPPVDARRLLNEAIELWRGPFAADVESPAAVIWDGRRVAAIEDRIDADVALGHAARLVAELQQLVEAHPWRERFRAQLALALHAAGRRAEALRALHAAREQLADAGLEPGAVILSVEQRLLVGDPASVADPAPSANHDFIGRASELDATAGLLTRTSLLTIVGPGGAGKTALVRELAHRSGDQSWFVDLAAVDEPSSVASAAAAALGVDEHVEAGLAGSLTGWAAMHTGTVVLDNCEHVLREAAELARQLSGNSGDGRVRVVATSRERLHVVGETVYRIGPMASTDARALFRMRLHEAGGDDDGDDEIVGSLCHRLDNLPLALELAASRAAAIGVTNVEQRLDDRLRLLGTDATGGRQSSLRSVLDWSVELLDDEERAMLRRLAVFAGTFDLDAAERVTGMHATCLARIVDKSLVHREGARFRLLETIHQYATELLNASGETDGTRAAHLAWCADREVIDEAVDAEVRVALDRARRAGPSLVVAGLARRAAVAALGRRLHTEAVARAEIAIEVAPDDVERGRGCVLLGEIWIGRWRGDPATAAYQQAIEAFATAGRHDLAARPQALLAEVTLRWPATVSIPTPDEEIETLIDAGLAIEADIDVGVASELWACRAVRRQLQDRLDEAESASLRAVELATVADDPVLISGALDALESVQMMQQRYSDADATSAIRMSLIARLPATPRGTMEHADILMMRSDTSLRIGDFATALRVSEQLVTFETERGLKLAGLARLARVKFFVGHWDDALREVDDMLAEWRRDGQPTATYLVSALGAAAAIHGLRGDRDGMHRFLDLAREVLRWRRMHNIWLTLCEANVLLADGEPAAAKELLDAITEDRHAWWSTHLAMTAEACVAMDDPSANERLAVAFAAVDGDRYSRAILLRATGAAEESATLFASLPCPWQAAATLPR